MRPLDRLKWLFSLTGAHHLPGAALRVAIVLAERAHRSDATCYPSHASLAKNTSLSTDSVKRALRMLEDRGRIAIERNAQGERPDRKTNRYRLLEANADPSLHEKKRGGHAAPNGGAFQGQTGGQPWGGKQGNRTRSQNKGSTRDDTPPAASLPPDRETFIAYCEKKGFGHIAERAFDYYSAGDWRDRNGKAIRNWKQKLISVWFDPVKNPPPERPAEERHSAEHAELLTAIEDQLTAMKETCS